MPLTGDAKREYQRRWIAKRKEDFFTGKCCVSCGQTEHLELDHKDPGQKVSHRIWSWSAVRRDAELAKCQVLCYDCHKKKTTQDISVIRSNISETMVCPRGHRLVEVGFYTHKDRVDGSPAVTCRYCKHLYDHAKRNTEAMSLDEFVLASFA